MKNKQYIELTVRSKHMIVFILYFSHRVVINHFLPLQLQVISEYLLEPNKQCQRVTKIYGFFRPTTNILRVACIIPFNSRFFHLDKLGANKTFKTFASRYDAKPILFFALVMSDFYIYSSPVERCINIYCGRRSY